MIFFFISVRLSKLQRSRGFVALFEKIYDGEPSNRLFLVSGRMYNTVVSIMSTRKKYVAARHNAVIWKQFFISIDRNGFAE